MRIWPTGADSQDDEETRARKALLVLVSLLVLPVSLLWGGLYLALGAPSGVLAFVYFAISLGAIAVFARTRDFEGILAPMGALVFGGVRRLPRVGHRR